MITRCYLEITNVCNLDCAFCPKTKRRKGALTMEQYDALTDRLKGNVKFLYFHLMGEPFVHRDLAQMVAMARDKGMVPVLTTNGTLLKGGEGVLDSRPYQIQISLHSQDGNGIDDIDGYVDDVIEPSETRYRLALALDMLASKQEEIPEKKHGNFPV